jgi:hypothetical protein
MSSWCGPQSQDDSQTGYLTLIDTNTKAVIGDPILINIVDTVDIGPDGTVYVTQYSPADEAGTQVGHLLPFKVTPSASV